MDKNLTKAATLVLFSPIIVLELTIGVVLLALMAVTTIGGWLWAQHPVGAGRRAAQRNRRVDEMPLDEIDSDFA